MFRNALRQSSRSVAAVSAPGRVAVSSVLLSHSLTTPPPPVPIDIPPTFPISNASSIASSIIYNPFAHIFRMVQPMCASWSSSLTSFSLCYRSARLSPAPSPVPLSRSVPTLLRPRLSLPRSPPSWSSAFVVFRRRLVSLRLVVFCRSGTSNTSHSGEAGKGRVVKNSVHGHHFIQCAPTPASPRIFSTTTE